MDCTVKALPNGNLCVTKEKSTCSAAVHLVRPIAAIDSVRAALLLVSGVADSCPGLFPIPAPLRPVNAVHDCLSVFFGLCAS